MDSLFHGTQAFVLEPNALKSVKPYNTSGKNYPLHPTVAQSGGGTRSGVEGEGERAHRRV